MTIIWYGIKSSASLFTCACLSLDIETVIYYHNKCGQGVNDYQKH